MRWDGEQSSLTWKKDGERGSAGRLDFHGRRRGVAVPIRIDRGAVGRAIGDDETEPRDVGFAWLDRKITELLRHIRHVGHIWMQSHGLGRTKILRMPKD